MNVDKMKHDFGMSEKEQILCVKPQWLDTECYNSNIYSCK